jgi:tol-pal system protein YbgF
MNRVRWAMVLVLATPLLCAGVDKEVVELQRQVALLDDRVQTLQRSLDEKMGAMMAIVQRTLDRVNDVSTQGAVLDNSLKQRLEQLEKSLAPSIASLNAQLGQVTSQSQAVGANVADLAARLDRLEQKLVDLDSAIRTLQTPPALPSTAETPAQPAAGMSAEELYQAATRDQLAGNDDLALREFSDYLQNFGDTQLAAGAQFHVAEIHYYRGDLDAALEAFQLFLKQHPDNGKAPDALYLTARIMEKQGKRAAAVQELTRLVRTYPNSDAADLARAELKGRTPARSATKK